MVKNERIKFLQVKTRREAQEQAPGYKVLVKVKGGFKAYRTYQDFYSTWQSFSPQCEYIY